MRILFLLIICGAVVGVGFNEISRQKSASRMLDEIVRFIKLYESQLNYKKIDYDEFYELAKQQNFKFILFNNKQIFLQADAKQGVESLFGEFIQGIGTTDAYGQQLLCKEYSGLFGSLLAERKSQEDNKIRVKLAVSVLCALGVFITFI